MSITLNLDVSAGLRIVLGSSDLKGFRVARAMAKAAAAVEGFEPSEKLNAQEQIIATQMLSDASDEEVLKFILKISIREHLGEAIREFAVDNCSDKKSARVSPVQVAFREAVNG